MGRIGLALALLIGWMSVAHAEALYCTPVELDVARIEKPATRPIPQITDVSLAVAGETEMLSIQGSLGADTDTIRITTPDGYTLVTTPDRGPCSTSRVWRHAAQLTIVTYDKAGNASAPFEWNMTAVHDKPERHYRCGTGVVILLIGSVVMSGGMFLVLVVIGFIRKRAPTTVAGEFVSPILAENVARIVARGYAIKLAVATLTTTGLWTFGHPFMAIMTGPFVLVWFIELVMSRFAVRQFDTEVRRLEKRDNWIYINSTKLYAPRRAWEKASALPSASVLD